MQGRDGIVKRISSDVFSWVRDFSSRTIYPTPAYAGIAKAPHWRTFMEDTIQP